MMFPLKTRVSTDTLWSIVNLQVYRILFIKINIIITIISIINCMEQSPSWKATSS